ncbi:hypothetical protein [Phenylobacterium sp.]|uniref:hypothetical protein n=1 Tax=Phenylobacterium sp. TaxID=1871053 RepID=UPI00272F1285|nr:hypothetical protein [Phenylobacterium sp.]MDP1872879.1 hypothetical protein [Phenylobacterium sp.]MDP3299707.1 hypothetical protein [Phenylobacterium sp.]MDP3490215.1 hypothetical protein [Phenylobacterium sp.]
MSSVHTPHTDSPWRRRAGKAVGALKDARSWAAGEPWDASPSTTLPLPGGGRMRLATDRVRAKPALSPQISFMLGQNAIGLGVWGLFFPRGVQRFLGLNTSPQTTQILFGAREMATGMSLFSDPTRAGVLWARVAGDVFDIAVLSALNRRSNPKRGNARLALGVVLAVTALDVITAARMTNVKRNCA